MGLESKLIRYYKSKERNYNLVKELNDSNNGNIVISDI